MLLQNLNKELPVEVDQHRQQFAKVLCFSEVEGEKGQFGCAYLLLLLTWSLNLLYLTISPPFFLYTKIRVVSNDEKELIIANKCTN